MSSDASATAATTRGRVAPVRAARGGISGGAILTGVVVAFGCMFLLSAVVAGVLTAFAPEATDLAQEQPVESGIGAGLALVVAQFVSYLWGGYTAGRMGRGAGLGNGLLVPLVAVLLAVVVGAVAAVLGATANLNLPFQVYRLPVEEATVVDWGVGIGVATLAAMFLGGAVGGSLGTRWHSRLEATAAEEDAVVQTSQTRTTDAPA